MVANFCIAMLRSDVIWVLGRLFSSCYIDFLMFNILIFHVFYLFFILSQLCLDESCLYTRTLRRSPLQQRQKKNFVNPKIFSALALFKFNTQRIGNQKKHKELIASWTKVGRHLWG